MTEIKRVSVDEARRLIDEEGYRYLDVRPAEDFAAGHPAGAHNIPFRVTTPSGPKPNAGRLKSLM